MIVLEDRRSLAHDIATAHRTGVRLNRACDIAGIDERTLQRWKAQDGFSIGDGRPQALRPTPSHALSPAKCSQQLRLPLRNLVGVRVKLARQLRHRLGAAYNCQCDLALMLRCDSFLAFSSALPS